MLVRTLRQVLIGVQVHPQGAILDLPDRQARLYIDKKAVVPHVEIPRVESPADPVVEVESATLPRAAERAAKRA